MVMLTARPGANICLFCSLHQSFRAQLSRRSCSASSAPYKSIRAGNHLAVNSYWSRTFHPRSAVSKGRTLIGGRDAVGSRFFSATSASCKQSRASRREDTPFRKNGRIPGSRLPGQLRLMDAVSIPGVARKILSQMSGLIDDPVFKFEMGFVGDNIEASFLDFEQAILHILETSPQSQAISKAKLSLIEAYRLRGEKGLESQLRYMLQAGIANRDFVASDVLNQIRLADARYPTEWYPRTRRRNRIIHLHIGPTNSGKTYHALKRLEEAKTGFYAGPLRLLAHEVYTRLNAKGKDCNLVTGDEIVIAEGSRARISSCTVEMAPVGIDLDVAVIDEIQMIGHKTRGWAWTQALLGCAAREVHLCGETRTLPLIREIAASLGEELIVHKYERLSPLKVATNSLGGRLENLRKGDCVITFSKKAIHGLKERIQKITGRDVAICYGALPPEIRAQQAKLFNDPDNTYDILVASDAIGMGLNLSIKRIVFETLDQFDGNSTTPINVPQIKQIGGRAGRYRSAPAAIATDSLTSQTNQTDPVNPSTPSGQHPETVGYVTTLHSTDLFRVKSAMKQEPVALRAAGLKVPDELIERFASFFPVETPFSYILLRLQEISRMNPTYFYCNIDQQVRVADAIQSVPNLSIKERLIFCCSPSDTDHPQNKAVVRALANIVANRRGGNLLDIPSLGLEVLDLPLPPNSKIEKYIMALTTSHEAIVLYIWLSYRLSSIFPSQALAFHTKTLLQEKLDKALSQSTGDRQWLAKRYKTIAKAKERQRLEKKDAQKLEASAEVADNKEETDDKVENSDGDADSVALVDYLDVDGEEGQGFEGRDVPPVMLPNGASLIPLTPPFDRRVERSV